MRPAEALGKIDQLSPREKIILLATTLVAILFLFLQFLWEPGWKEAARLSGAKATANSETAALAAQQELLGNALRQDPNARLREENMRLAERLKDLQDQLRDSLSRLVTPEEMPVVLTELLGAVPTLQVKQVIKLPTEKIQHGEGEGAAVLFSHRVQVVAVGDYFAALRYIRQIENETSRLRLVSMDYLVDQYPLALITVEVETLGLDERWLGV